MNAHAEGDPAKHPLRLRRTCGEVRPVISELYVRRVEKMEDLWLSTMDRELYYHPERWTREYARCLARRMNRIGCLDYWKRER